MLVFPVYKKRLTMEEETIRQTQSKEKVVFVTVGTTRFDRLIETITTIKAQEALKKQGFTKLVLQVGNGAIEPRDLSTDLLTVEYFRFKPNLLDDIKNAELVISHAGAGSVLEALEAQKTLLVVVNENLMDNHQVELAQQLLSTGHLSFCTCRNLPDTLGTNLRKVNQYIPGDPSNFSVFIDQIMEY